MSLAENHTVHNVFFEILISPTHGHNTQPQNNELRYINGCGDVVKFPLFQREYLRHNKTVEDIEKKLERASERRNNILQELKERNENIVLKAMYLAKQKEEKLNRFAADLKNRLEINLALKESRRQHFIDEKVEYAKKKSYQPSTASIERSFSMLEKLLAKDRQFNAENIQKYFIAYYNNAKL